MKTLVELENSNCTWCHGAMLSALRQRAGVKGVWSDFSSGCLVIDHEDDPDALVALVKSTGRAVTVAGNGEKMMVSLDGHEAAECSVSNDAVRARSDEQGPAAAFPTSPPGGDPGFTVPRPSASWSPPATVSTAGLADPESGFPRGGAGIRVLSREQPFPGLLLRAARDFRRAFRVVLRLLPGRS